MLTIALALAIGLVGGLVVVPAIQGADAANGILDLPNKGQRGYSVINLIKNSNFATYENGTFYGIRIQYPSDWEINDKIDETGGSVHFVSPLENIIDDYREELAVTLDEEAKSFRNLTLYNYETHVVASLQQIFPNINFTSSTNTTVAGLPAINLGYSFFSGPRVFQAMHLITLKDNRPYNVVYASEAEKYETYLPTMAKMIESLELLDVPFFAYVNDDYRIRINYPSNWTK